MGAGIAIVSLTEERLVTNMAAVSLECVDVGSRKPQATDQPVLPG